MLRNSRIPVIPPLQPLLGDFITENSKIPSLRGVSETNDEAISLFSLFIKI